MTNFTNLSVYTIKYCQYNSSSFPSLLKRVQDALILALIVLNIFTESHEKGWNDKGYIVNRNVEHASGICSSWWHFLD